MKSIKLTLLCLLIANIATAQQNWDTLPFKNYADYKLQNLNKNLISTGILYDRVFPMANVDEYTGVMVVRKYL